MDGDMDHSATAATPTAATAARLDVARIRKDFPILDREGPWPRLVYLDSASSSQRPSAVIDAMSRYYERNHANVHRSVYLLAAEATEMYESARRTVARFIGAPSADEVVFAKNVTETINLVAHTWARANLKPGDPILITEIEHHANIVPWLMLAEERGIELRYLPMADDYTLDLSDLDRLLDGVKLVSFTALSNVLGTITPARRLIDAAHAVGAVVLIDAAQYVPHIPTDVGALGADFVAFTGHKMLGPTGIGVLWGRRELLDAMPAFLGGGEMILDVRLDGWTPNVVPHKFEAGTPPIAEAVGLAAAIDYLESIGMDEVRRHDHELMTRASQRLAAIDGVTVHGPAPAERSGIVSFSVADVHPHDVATVLDQDGVCIRAGHHCCQPLMRRLGVAGTARASFYVYNDDSDVNALVTAVESARDLFARAG
jgi:cysteine desulfurase/selenocysteine lyase